MMRFASMRILSYLVESLYLKVAANANVWNMRPVLVSSGAGPMPIRHHIPRTTSLERTSRDKFRARVTATQESSSCHEEHVKNAQPHAFVSCEQP
eukprot:787895-Amphidinium_carterae.2